MGHGAAPKPQLCHAKSLSVPLFLLIFTQGRDPNMTHQGVPSGSSFRDTVPCCCEFLGRLCAQESSALLERSQRMSGARRGVRGRSQFPSKFPQKLGMGVGQLEVFVTRCVHPQSPSPTLQSSASVTFSENSPRRILAPGPLPWALPVLRNQGCERKKWEGLERDPELQQALGMSDSIIPAINGVT